MNFEVTDIKVYKTCDYEGFNKLLGNRSVTENRVNAIIESINSVGYQPVPILCNEKFEIADGQGRLSACERLGLPIYFIIKPGIGIEECIAMNIKMQNWTIYDFIYSYIAQGKEDYVKLSSYYDELSSLNLMGIAMCMSDEAWSKNVDRPLRSGNYKISETEENKGCLDFIKGVIPYLDGIRGGHQQYIPILIGLYKFNLIDDVHMTEAIKNHVETMKSAYNAETALFELQEVYNYHRSKKNRFRDAYLNLMEDKGARYKG